MYYLDTDPVSQSVVGMHRY